MHCHIKRFPSPLVEENALCMTKELKSLRCSFITLVNFCDYACATNLWTSGNPRPVSWYVPHWQQPNASQATTHNDAVSRYEIVQTYLKHYRWSSLRCANANYLFNSGWQWRSRGIGWQVICPGSTNIANSLCTSKPTLWFSIHIFSTSGGIYYYFTWCQPPKVYTYRICWWVSEGRVVQILAGQTPAYLRWTRHQTIAQNYFRYAQV